jgi:hypothetical protein
MKDAVAWFSIGYVVLCEWLIGILVIIGLIPLWIEAVRNQNDSKGVDAMILSIFVTVCIASGYGLIRKRRWGWFMSLMLGLAVAVFGSSGIWSAFEDTPYSRMEGGFLFGTGMLFLVPSMVGIILLNLPQTRRFVFRGHLSPAASPLL